MFDLIAPIKKAVRTITRTDEFRKGQEVYVYDDFEARENFAMYVCPYIDITGETSPYVDEAIQGIHRVKVMEWRWNPDADKGGNHWTWGVNYVLLHNIITLAQAKKEGYIE